MGGHGDRSGEPAEIKLRQSDFEQDVSWQDFKEPTTLTENDLAFDVLDAGLKMAGGCARAHH